MSTTATLMTVEDLKELIAQGEGPTLEFKRSTAELREALQTVCGFLNTSGGKVIIGVKPEGTLLGQQVSDKTLRDIAQMIQGFEPPANIDIERIKIRPDAEAIILSVSRANEDIPIVFEGRAYELVQSTTRKMSQQRYQQLLFARSHSKHRWENQPAEGITIKDIDREEVFRIVNLATSQGNLSGPTERNLARLLDRLGVRVGDQILRAAVVLFGKRFIPDYPQCELLMARFKGTDKTEFMDQKSLRGPAFKLLEEAQLFCQRHFPLPGKIVPEDFRRQDKPLIPPLALREILVNALIHKDYTIAGGSTHVAIFDDRVEVWSAGRLPAGVTAEGLSKEHLSVRRNPIIADVFHLVGLVEKWGRGTNRVIEQCQVAGIEPPSFREVGPATVVTFKVPVRLAATPQVTPQDTPQHAPQDAPQLRALLEAAEKPRSRADLQAAVGLKDRKHFRKLYLSPSLAAGWIEPILPGQPYSRFQRYRITDKGLSFLQTTKKEA